jgi:hypothetical protein
VPGRRLRLIEQVGRTAPPAALPAVRALYRAVRAGRGVRAALDAVRAALPPGGPAVRILEVAAGARCTIVQRTLDTPLSREEQDRG